MKKRIRVSLITLNLLASLTAGTPAGTFGGSEAQNASGLTAAGTYERKGLFPPP
jgi:hypothetical protein